MMRQQGYTLVEMLVALAVTSIVLSGTYAAYTFFAQQQQKLLTQTEIDRGVLRFIDLIQSDIRMAGYEDYAATSSLKANQAIVSTDMLGVSSDVSFLYDERDSAGQLYRAVVHYFLVDHVSTKTGLNWTRLKRDVRKCRDPANCTIGTSDSTINVSDTDGAGEPVLDWVTKFDVSFPQANLKASGKFAGQPQIVQITLVVNAPQVIEGTNRMVTKTFTFLTRAKNVSIVS